MYIDFWLGLVLFVYWRIVRYCAATDSERRHEELLNKLEELENRLIATESDVLDIVHLLTVRK